MKLSGELITASVQPENSVVHQFNNSTFSSQIPDVIYIRKRSTREKKNQMWSPCTMPGEELAEQYQAIDVTVPICIATLELAELQSRRRAT